MAKPAAEVLRDLVDRVLAPIPSRPRPRPKPRKTWKGHKVGDRLRQRGFLWEVESCDSQGITLRVVEPYRGTTTLYLTDEADLADYSKLPKPRARKRKEKVQ